MHGDLARIVTHPGGAHKDEVLAVCLLVARQRVPVFRREPTSEDLADPRVAVIDVGGEHAPSRSNYDHHHFPREHPPTCALSLVLDDLGLYEQALKFCDWLEPAEWFDSRGPKRTAEWMGVPRRAIGRLLSPVDVTLLRRFAQTERVDPGEPLYEFMAFVGQDLLAYLQGIRDLLDLVAARVQTWVIETPAAPLQAVFLPRTEPPLDEPSAAVGAYVRDAGLTDAVAVLVYPDRRGPGYALARYEDHPALDFSQIADEPDVRFAHVSGFLCKVDATEPKRLRELVVAAAVGPTPRLG
ncbi:MAG: MYG1 family protein [Myxococcales bacterium FL481]|nr:MAG: MYG1 family protein [Myxococcales bacterium FL481]